MTNLEKVKSLLAKEENWGKWNRAVDKNNWQTDPKASDAVCFCLFGAIERVCESQVEIQRTSALLGEVIIKINRFTTITSFNDHNTTTHKDVLEVLDFAIEAEKQLA